MAEEIKFLDKTGLTQVISHLQQDTEEKIAAAIEDAIFAGGSDENVDNLPYLDAEKLNGYTSDDFVKVADLGTTTVGLATADAEGNVISETYAKNSDVNSNFTNLQSQIDTKVDKTITINGKTLSTDVTITAADVGADAQGAAANALQEAKTYADTASATALSNAKEYNDAAYANANLYTDTAIANLINGAPTTLDTLKEIADAMAENDEVVAALDTAIGTKANQNELDGHTENTTIHITADERTNWNSKAPGIHTHTKSQITDFPTSMPASDVYSWAKAASKPSYTYSEVGAAPTSHGHTSIASLGDYTFDSSTLPNSFAHGLSLGFVNSNSGFGSFGTVLTARGFSGGGGTLQLYAPYSNAYGGTHMKARFGDYEANSGNSWTELKDVAWVSDIPTYTSQLTNNSGYITASGSITGNAATATTAARLARSGDTSVPMTFNWSGLGGQPTWLWGGEDGNNMYVYNPANFSVNYANSAGSATNATTASMANAVWTQSHNGSWYINSIWDGTYFQVNAKSTDGSELPVGVNYAAYANAAGTISNQGSAATKDIVHTTTDPGAGTASSYKEGSIICVYE